MSSSKGKTSSAKKLWESQVPEKPTKRELTEKDFRALCKAFKKKEPIIRQAVNKVLSAAPMSMPPSRLMRSDVLLKALHDMLHTEYENTTPLWPNSDSDEEYIVPTQVPSLEDLPEQFPFVETVTV